MKQQEIVQLSDGDLQERIADFKDQLQKLELTHVVSPLENPMQIREIRKTVARLNTELTKRQKQA
ncbi:50S ribosomal protein L29 [Wandonia haliotis]|uniref:Large ribosomal subunit protein uL29 n=1 Tax=Wandonia haliotis TaxID=574963 RepID=A0ABN1MTT2_9FLAO